jgi:hypothetical protein
LKQPYFVYVWHAPGDLSSYGRQVWGILSRSWKPQVPRKIELWIKHAFRIPDLTLFGKFSE